MTLDDALSVLVNLEHRGGTGLERNTGDGAGVLFQIPHRFFRKEAQKEGQLLPDEGDYGVAMLFFPHDDPQGVARRAAASSRRAAPRRGVPLMFWREVPVDPHDLGSTAQACMPTILQAFLRRPESAPRRPGLRAQALCVPPHHRARGRRQPRACRQDLLRVLHVQPHHRLQGHARGHADAPLLHRPQRRRGGDLAWPSCTPATPPNTTPSWERAHPNRYIIHNGEINTLRGNVSLDARPRAAPLQPRRSAMTCEKVAPHHQHARARTPPSWTTCLEFLDHERPPAGPRCDA